MKPDRPICCDDRAVRVRRDACLSAEQQSLMGHLESCPDCRIERQLMADFEQSAAAQALDEELIARAAMRALTPVKTRRMVWQRWAAAAAMLLLAGAASAAIGLRIRNPDWPTVRNSVDPGKARPSRRSRSATGAGAKLPVEPPAAPDPQLSPPAPPPVPAPAPAPAITVPPARTTPTMKASRSAVGPRLARAPQRRPEPQAAPVEHPETAASLFASALEARDGGHLGQAIASLRALEQRFPNSNQALVALVSLGDLLLRAGSVADGLLAFEHYLARSPSGTLAPEALAGKARALDTLGRHEEAQSTRKEIARRFPLLPYAGSPGRP